MGTMIIHHLVGDYKAWRPAYDRHEPMRNAAGLTNGRVFRSADDPNDLLILLDMADLGRAKEFAVSEDLRSAMQGAGVVGKPELHYIE
jgi:hypothetical protein